MDILNTANMAAIFINKDNTYFHMYVIMNTDIKKA